MKRSKILNKLTSKILLITALLISMGFAEATKEAGPKDKSILNREKIKTCYYNGDFEEILKRLELFSHTHQSMNRMDSLFVFRYLGIIYASNPELETKGEGYLYTLIKMDPDVDFSDMLLSKELEQLIEKVRMRYYKYHKKTLPSKAAQSAPVTTPVDAQSPDKGSRKWLWAAGGTAIAALAVTTLIAVNKEPDKTENLILLNVE